MQYFPTEARLDKMFFPYYGKKAHVRANWNSVSSFCCTITFCLLWYTRLDCPPPYSDLVASMSLPHFMSIGQLRAAGRCCAAPAGKGGFQRWADGGVQSRGLKLAQQWRPGQVHGPGHFPGQSVGVSGHASCHEEHKLGLTGNAISSSRHFVIQTWSNPEHLNLVCSVQTLMRKPDLEHWELNIVMIRDRVQLTPDPGQLAVLSGLDLLLCRLTETTGVTLV